MNFDKSVGSDGLHARGTGLTALSSLSLVLVLLGGCKGDDVTGDGEEGDETADETGPGDGDGDSGDGDGDGTDDGFVPPPGGMRRMLDYQYANSIEYMFGPEAAAVAMADVISGHMELMIGNLPGPYPMIMAGKLRGLAVTSGQRSPPAANRAPSRRLGV